jgi:membrane protein required for colicin V production
MLIDILVGIVLLLAIWKGYRNGLIVGIFSLFALFIGIAAALKLSVVVAKHIGEATKISEKWLPFISFLLVFIVVVLLVRLVAKIIEASVKMALLGWANRLGGVICYVVLYMIILSIVLFYAEKMEILQQAVIKSSRTYPFIQPWGPKAINFLGDLIPWFRNMFAELEKFFGNMSKHIQ